MDYKIVDDIKIVRELLDMTTEEFAEAIGVSRITLNNWKNHGHKIRRAHMDAFYNMAFRKGIRLNKIKEQLYKEDYCSGSHKILFHGAKTIIDGKLNIQNSRRNNDFGQGFYCGESLEQSAMFVSGYPESSLYIMDFNRGDLQKRRFDVSQNWMLLIAYFRGRLGEFEMSAAISELKESIVGIDYIVAPIADNRMFEIIDSFIDGEITDEQCRHCLSATNLGNQYIFLTQKALEQLHILEHCYLCQEEKEFYLNSRRDSVNMNRDKVRVARKQYRGRGKYIEEILE